MSNPTATIQLRVLRPLMFRGDRCEAGARLKVSPNDAAQLLSSGRAALEDERDADAVRAAIEDETRRVIGRVSGRAPDPWVPLRG